jgi:tripartite-type tricarboxylate transporter receptor subunit TctC
MRERLEPGRAAKLEQIADQVAALLGRQITAISDSSSWREQVLAGQFRLLSVWTPTRLPSFPEAPTLRELGYGMSVTSPYGITGPRGMEPEVVDFLHRAFRKALLDEGSQRIMAQWEMPNEYLGPQAYAEFARERAVFERETVARLGLSID